MAARKKIVRKAKADGETAPEDILGAVQRDLEGSVEGGGRGVVIRRMTDDHFKPFDAVPFGIPPLDTYLHGGIPNGRITEIYGPESSGKTTLCYHALATMVRENGVGVYIDSEHAFDAPYAERIGVDLDRVFIVQPEWGEQAFRTIRNFCHKMELRRAGYDPDKPLKSKPKTGLAFQKCEPWKNKAVILVDSVAALVPRSEWERLEEGDYETRVPAEPARMMSNMLRPLTGPISRAQVACLMTNQVRSNIAVTFGSKQTTPGGNALKFYASSRWRTGHRGMLKRGSAENAPVVGRLCSIQVVKCKLFNPFAPELVLPFTERGIDMAHLLFDTLMTLEVIKKDGSWYHIEKTGHPYDAVKWQGTNGYFELVDNGGFDINVLTELARTS